MTHHLTPDEIVDLAEGVRSEAAAPHLTSCERCRRQLQDVRDAMTAAQSADIPEPSPLFWDHFSARVADAIASSRETPRSFLSFNRWNWSRAAVALSVAACVVAAAAVTLRNGHRAPVQPVAADRRGDPAPLADDPLLDLVADLGVDVDWESAAEVGLTTREGTADRAVIQLTDAERAELQRLLEQELKRSGD
jgi:hypothetical protein